MTKQFNYKIASVQDIANHFLNSSRQVVSHARGYYKDDKDMHLKITEAYKIYVLTKKGLN
jgi:hypothetical protein